MKTLVLIDTQSVAFDFSNKKNLDFLKPLGDYSLCISYFSYLELLAKPYSTIEELLKVLDNLSRKDLNYSSPEGYPDVDKIIDLVLARKIYLPFFTVSIVRLLNALKFEYVLIRTTIEHFIYYLIKKTNGHMPDDKTINNIIDDYNANEYERLIKALSLESFRDQEIDELLQNKSKQVKQIMGIQSFKKTIKSFFAGLEEVQIVNLIYVFCRKNGRFLKLLKNLPNIGTVVGFDIYYQIFEYAKHGKTLEPKINNIVDFYNICLIGENTLLLSRDNMVRCIIDQLSEKSGNPSILKNKKLNDIFVSKFDNKNNISKVY